jgi:hypothetical protein
MSASPNAQNYTHVLISTNVFNHIALSTPLTTIDVKTLAESIVPFAPLTAGPKSPFGFQPIQHPNGPCFGQQSMFNPGEVFRPGGIFSGKPSIFPTAPSVTNQYPQYDQSRTPDWVSPVWNPAGAVPQNETKPTPPESRTTYESGKPCQKQQDGVAADIATPVSPPLESHQLETIEAAQSNLSLYIGKLFFTTQQNIQVKKLVALTCLSGMLAAVKKNSALWNTYREEIYQTANPNISGEFLDMVCAKTKVLDRVTFDMTKP